MCNLGVVWDGDREQPTCGIASFILFFLFRARGIQFWICVLGILICIKIPTNTTNSLQRDRFLHHFANISYCVRWNARTRAKRVMWIIAQLFAHMSEHAQTHTHTYTHANTFWTACVSAAYISIWIADAKTRQSLLLETHAVRFMTTT